MTSLHPLIAGVDEAGRGPLAGPVVTAAVILPHQHGIVGLADSKKISEKKRLELMGRIRASAVDWATGEASVEEIDQMNILQATLLAMVRAISGLKIVPDLVLVDGNQLPALSCPAQAVVGGDALVECISAASIIAKVTRDALLIRLDSQYPGYGLSRHKGYPTKQHIEALAELGVSPIHRRSFAPVRRLIGAD